MLFWSSIVRLNRDKRGVAAIEFAIVVPVLVFFIIGVFDISKAMILYQEVYNAAHTIPLTASSLAVQPDHSTALTLPQTQQSMSAIYAEMPWVRNGVETGTRSVTMSSVIFIQTDSSCTANCLYTPQVAWSVAYTGGNANGFSNVLRACGSLKQTTPTGLTAGDLTSLPTQNITNPDPIVVVDVHYRYTPLFFEYLTGPVDFWASGFWPVRSVAPNVVPSQQYTKFDSSAGQGAAVLCPGYPASS